MKSYIKVHKQKLENTWQTNAKQQPYLPILYRPTRATTTRLTITNPRAKYTWNL